MPKRIWKKCFEWNVLEFWKQESEKGIENKKNVDNVWLNLTIAITGTIIVMGTRIFVARTYNL